jgi:hypothetical protein
MPGSDVPIVVRAAALLAPRAWDQREPTLANLNDSAQKTMAVERFVLILRVIGIGCLSKLPTATTFVSLRLLSQGTKPSTNLISADPTTDDNYLEDLHGSEE